MQTWTITTENAGKRLDHFLAALHPEVSRATIQKKIKDGTVTVNGKAVMVHRFLKTNDVLVWKELAAKPSSATKKPGAAPFKLTVIDETKDWLVIDKPAGLIVHPDAKTKEGTLIDLLVAHEPKIARVGEHPDRPGIVHRLDREVSGLMVIAKTQAAYESLVKQFSQHHVKKTYLALVHGVVSPDQGDIKFRIARSTSKARMAARPVEEEGGKAAWTNFRVKERFIGATLLELEILSGRTHQIRAHMHAIQHPVIGDSLYTIRRTDRNVAAPRLMLQSVGLSFTDPTSGKEQSFHLEPVPAFQTLIDEFRRS